MNTLKEESIHPPNWHELTVTDAKQMGRIAALGIALPNAKHLRIEAQAVEDPKNPQIQREINRIQRVAQALQFAGVLGLAHNQLDLREESPHGLRMMIAPLEIPNAEPLFTVRNKLLGKTLPMQCLMDVELIPPENPTPDQLSAMRQGCFSGGPAMSEVEHYKVLDLVRATLPSGERVEVRDVSGLIVPILEHEQRHGKGIQTSDGDPHRKWVGPDHVDEYYEGTHNDWRLNFGDDQWRAFTRDPDYDYLPTSDLKAAFLEGHAEQERLMADV